MDDTAAAARRTGSSTEAGGAIGLTALGRVHLRVPEEDGFEEVVVERRWPDLASARGWCERAIRRSSAGTVVVEIQVFEESWRHARSWETIRTHPVIEAMQVGVPADSGRTGDAQDTTVRWSELRSMSPRSIARPVL